MPLKRTELTGSVIGPLADLCLIQTFGYSAAECDRTLEALYRFPLSGDAAESLFTTPLDNARQVERLLASAGKCLFLEDAHKTMAVLK